MKRVFGIDGILTGERVGSNAVQLHTQAEIVEIISEYYHQTVENFGSKDEEEEHIYYTLGSF